MKKVTIVADIDEKKTKWLQESLKEKKTIKGIKVVKILNGDAASALAECQKEMVGLLSELHNSGLLDMSPEEAKEILDNNEIEDSLSFVSKRQRRYIPKC